MIHAPIVCDRCKKYKKACDKRLVGCSRCTRLSVKCTYSPRTGIRQLSPEASLESLLSRGTVEVENQVTSESRRILDAISRVDLKNMCDTYFHTFHEWLPFVDRDDFETAFTSYTDDFDAQRHRRTYLSHFSVLFLSVILIAHLSSKTVVCDKESPAALYHAAKSLHSLLQSWGKASLELVQAGLNIAAYEHCQARGQDAWLTTGGCARMAQVMGLHQTVKVGGKASSGVGFETWKCVWWAVVVLERVIAGEFNQGRLPFASAPPTVDDALPISSQDKTPHVVSDDLVLPHMIDEGDIELLNRDFTKISPFGSTVQATYISSLVTNHINSRGRDPVLWETEARRLDAALKAFSSSLIPPPGKSVGSYCGAYGMIMTAAFSLNTHLLSSDPAAGLETTSRASLSLQSSARIIVQSTQFSSTGIPMDLDKVAFWAHGLCARSALVVVAYNIPGVEYLKTYLRFFEPRHKIYDNYLREIEAAEAARKART